jgi:uncharacterized protein with GYD domain
LSDNGSAYIAKDNADIARALDVNLLFTPVRSPESNGISESLGGKVETWYYAFGDADIYAIADLPDSAAAAALTLAVNQSGGATTKTVVLITPDEMDKAAKKAVSYRPPGH